MIRKTNSQNNINFMFGDNEEKVYGGRTKEEISKKSKRRDNDDLKYMSTQQNRESFNPITSNKNTIISSICENDASNNKQLGGMFSNSILDPDKISKISENLDSKKRINQEKEEKKQKRIQIEKEENDKKAELSKDIETRKSTSIISSDKNSSDTSYKGSKNNISIFDNLAFEKLPQKTAGELIKEQNQERKNIKDDSWKNNGKSLTSDDLNKKLFDNFFK